MNDLKKFLILKRIPAVMLLWMLVFTYAMPAQASETVAKEYCTVADDELSLREKPGNHTKIIHRLGKTAKLEYIEREGFWAKVVFKGDTCYAMLNSLSFSDNVKATLPGWVNLDETHGKWGSLGYYFSTDRIMEALPDFNILQDRTPIDPELCFKIAFWLLLVSGIAFPFLKGLMRLGNIWFWLFYGIMIVLSVCELIYVFGSPDPLGFCDVNNVWWPIAWFYVFLAALALYQQLAMFSYILFVIQADREVDFKAGICVKIPFLLAIYFIITIIAYFFDFSLPKEVNMAAIVIFCLPLVLMIYGAVRGNDLVSLLLSAPFYVIAGAAILAIYCLVGMAVVVLAFIALVLMLSGDDKMYGKIGNTWYVMNYEYFDAHRGMISEISYTNPFEKD